MKNWTANIEHWKVDKLIPYAKNSRTHSDAQVAQIAASIVEFGFTNPILAGSDGVIVAGHGRLLAAHKLGLETVPVVVLDHLTQTQRKALVIADNRLALNAGWDEDMLRLELADLKMDNFDMDLTGFEPDELADLFKEETPIRDDDTEPQIDRAEELRQQWGVEPGQLWILGNHRLLCGDSTKAEDVWKVLGNAKPLLMVTDPPYGVEYEPGWRSEPSGPNSEGCKRNHGASIGKVLNDDQADWREAWALFPGDVAYVWHAPGPNQATVLESLIKSGFDARNHIIWAKNHLVIGRGDYHYQHEPCWYCVRKGKPGLRTDDRKQTTLWQIDNPVKSETGHSTQKPIECMARPIRNHDIQEVYEPFSGSGTTIIACENLNRRCFAIELSPGYVAVALQRWAEHTGKTPVLSDGKQTNDTGEQ